MRITDSDIRKSIDNLWSYDNIAYLVEGGYNRCDESKHNLTMEIVGVVGGESPNKGMRVMFSISFSDDLCYTNSDMTFLYNMFVRCKECCGSGEITMEKMKLGLSDSMNWTSLYIEAKLVLNKHDAEIKDMFPWSGSPSFLVEAIRCYY